MIASFGREGDLLIAVLFLALVAVGAIVAWLLDGDRRLRHLIAVAREGRPASAPTSASSGPDSASLPWPAAPPVGGSGPDITRLVADVLLVARGFDPAEERAGVNGSGVLDLAEREAAAVMAALRDGDGRGRWMA